MIYLDNAATTRVSEAAAREAVRVMRDAYGNPSSVHDFGYDSAKALKSARKAVLSALGSNDRGDELFFTSGGTESNNLAIFGALKTHRHGGKTVFFSDSEHASNYRIAQTLAENGYNVRFIPTRGGKLDLDFCRENFSKDTVLISCMCANNETGALYDIAALNELRNALCPAAILHTDGVQAFCKTDFSLCSTGADLISVSGHKIHAPKGVGALYVKKGVRIAGILCGGGQEKDIRPGTEALPSICATAVAAEEVNRAENRAHVAYHARYLSERIAAELPEVTENRPAAALPYVVSLTLPSVKSEVMLRYLSAKEIYVSAGSACSSKHRENRVLSAFGLDPKSADCTIRVSFCETNTTEEIDTFVGALRDGIRSLASLR